MEPLGILSLDRKKYTQAMAENLPALRARLGLSQTQLADCIGDLIERRILRQLAGAELDEFPVSAVPVPAKRADRKASACDGDLYGRAGAYFFLY